MLAKQGISWESEQHLQFVGDVFSKIHYAAIEASSEIAKEKGSYTYFEGSDWQTGKYFDKRHLKTEKWNQLREKSETAGTPKCLPFSDSADEQYKHYRRNECRT